MIKSLLFVLIAVFSVNVLAQNVAPGFDLSNYGVRIEPDKRVMIVLAALESARTTNAEGESVPVINTKLSPEGDKYRELLKSDLAALPADLRQKISNFVIQHKARNPKLTDAQLVAPFISMAYALTPAPELADPVVTSDLPGNLLDVLDFAPLVRDFYRRSSMSGNIVEYVKSYQRVADKQLRSSARAMVSDLLDYLHTRPQLFFTEKIKTEVQKGKSKTTKLRQVETREHERRFFIVPEMLAPVGDISFINVRDDYYLILPAESDLSFSEGRRAFLQFVIDPLVNANAKDIETIRPMVKKLLDDRQKVDPAASPDVYLTLSRSLVAAIDAKQSAHAKIEIATTAARQRIDNTPADADKRKIVQELEHYKSGLADETALQLSEDYEKGAILDFYFAEQLKGLEDSGFDIAASMKEMLLSFDPAKETGRLAEFAEARKRALAAREEHRNSPAATFIAENPVTTRLVEIQKLIDAKNYDGADAALEQLRVKNPTEPRIYYNIGRVASLSAESLTEPEKQKAALVKAKSAYDNVIKTATRTTDPALVSLTYVALAKIFEFYDQKAYAIALYDKAIQIGDIPGGGRDEAIAGKARLIKDQ